METGVSEGTKLEEIMKKCKPGCRIVVESGNEVDYLGVRRREMIAAFALAPGTAPNPESLYRKEIEDIEKMIGEDNIVGISSSFIKGVCCVGSHDFQRNIEYEIPEGASYVRRGQRKIRFFKGAPLKEQGNGKKKFVEIPKGAIKLKNSGGSYTWLIPDPAKEGTYMWV